MSSSKIHPMAQIIRWTILLLDILPLLSLSYLLVTAGQWILDLNKQKLLMQIPTNQYLLVFAISEALFWVYCTCYTTRLTPTAVDGRREITNEARRQLFDEVVSTLEGKDRKAVDEWLRGWFYVDKVCFEEGKPLADANEQDQEVKRGNVEELISGIFFASPLSAVHSNPLHNHSLISMITRLELLRNFRFTSGYNTSLKALCPSLDRKLVKSEYRPLLFYMCMASCQRVFEGVVWVFGFRRARQGKMEGWYYSPSSPGLIVSLCRFTIAHFTFNGDGRTSESNQVEIEETKQPIIFIPGLAGPFFLTHLIHNLIVLDRPILVIDQPHLSLKLRFTSRDIPSLPELSKDILTFLERQGYDLKNGDKPMIVAHSLGSALASSLMRQISNISDTSTTGEQREDRTGNPRAPCPKSNLKLILLDPISILLTHPHLSQTIYRPSHGNNNESEGAMDILIRYFIREQGMAQFLTAEFNQFDSFFPVSHYGKIMGKDNLKVILSERDHLLPISEIGQYLTRYDVSHEVLRGVQHGLWLVHWRSYRKVWGSIRRMAESPSSRKENDIKVSTPSSSIEVDPVPVPVPVMSRNRSKSLLICQMIKLPSSTSASPLKMSRMRSRTISISPQYNGQDYNDQQSMSRQCSSIGMNRTLNVSRFKRC